MGEQMASLIEELQHDALNSNVRVGDLLRKAKIIAVKLDLPEFEKWVENELNGYKAKAKNGITRCQWRRQIALIVVYLASQWTANSLSARSASSAVVVR
jgi:hypothetical protein